jgi:hypothetical protein
MYVLRAVTTIYFTKFLQLFAFFTKINELFDRNKKQTLSPKTKKWNRREENKWSWILAKALLKCYTYIVQISDAFY